MTRCEIHAAKTLRSCSYIPQIVYFLAQRISNHRQLILYTMLSCLDCQNMYVDAPASTWMTLPRPAVTLTFDLQNLIRSSVRTSEYSLSVVSKCSSRSWDIVVTISDRTNERGGWTAWKPNAFTDIVEWGRHKNSGYISLQGSTGTKNVNCPRLIVQTTRIGHIGVNDVNNWFSPFWRLDIKTYTEAQNTRVTGHHGSLYTTVCCNFAVWWPCFKIHSLQGLTVNL